MPKKARSSTLLPGQPNHIVVRGNNRRRLFSYARDYLRYVRLLNAGLRKPGIAIHAICLMANHVHLLLTPGTVAVVSALMKRVNQRYAQLRNDERGGTGKLFEQSFRSEPIESDSHLAFCVLYINANPFRANVRSCRQYRWSTQALHSGESRCTPVDSFISFDDWYLSLGSDSSERAAAYRARFDRYMAGDIDPDFLLRAQRMEPPSETRRRLERPNRTSAA